MTAILQKMRTLDAQYKRGEIDATEYARLKSRLRRSIEEAEPVVIDGAATPVPELNVSEPAPAGGMPLGLGLVICLGVVGACMGLALMLFADVSFGITLGVTLLAALTVALFRNLEEDE
ncbi:MAG: SHOCT domain-containing protein [Pseudomonadota bacterium]